MPEGGTFVTVSRPPRGFVDERGEILNLVDADLGSALVIRSVKGSIRGNHYHLTDYHYCWLLSGGLDYYQRRVGDTEVDKFTIRPGDLFFTPPMYEHAMHFSADSILFCCARNKRTQEHYESDTVRIRLLSSATP